MKDNTQVDQGSLLLEHPTSPPDEDNLDLLDLALILVKRKKLVIVTTAVCAIVATVVSFLLPNRYTATTTILPPRQSQSAASLLLSQLGGGSLSPLATLGASSLGLKNPSDIYIGILQSRSIADPLIQKFRLQDVYHDRRLSDTRKDLSKNTDFEIGKEGLISISVEDKNAQRAAALANAYVEELRDVTQHLAVTEAAQRRLFFEEQLQQAKDALSVAEVALKESQQKSGMLQLDSQSRVIIEAVATIRAQIAAKEVELQAISTYATDENPQKIVAQQELTALRAQLAKLEHNSGSAGTDPLVAVGNLPAAGLEYVRRLREVKYRETIFELLAKQYEAAKLDEAKEAAVIQVLDPAVAPDKKSSPKRSLVVGLVALITFFLVVGYVLLSNAFVQMRKRESSSWRLDQLLNNLTRWSWRD